MIITRRVEFSSSHMCSLPGLSAEENRRLYGEGANPNGHGHNYVLEVSLEGEPDPITGMIVDLKDLKQWMNEEVVEPFDHRHLNYEVKPFDKIVPTAENVALEIWRRLEPRTAGTRAKLHTVRLWETNDLYVEVTA
ncbi:MAG: 6-carboxytetrahydropterin synthase [Bryobacteraceae bacterium]|nr:6-carboxytetrahydropterin synthase [Bryobacteraceae bacterium]